MFPLKLTQRLVDIFGFAGSGCVLDPFMGTGSTLCAAYARGLPAVGLEISPEYIDTARRRLAAVDGGGGARPLIIRDDARNLGRYLAPETVGLCVTSPPYWDILNQRRTADAKPLRNYGESLDDLGNITDYHAFLDALTGVFAQVYTSLIPGAYCVAVVMDVRKKAQFYPLHMDLALRLRGIGFTLDDIIIWDRRQEYNRLRPLGYPHVFRVNKIHEYLLIFQKRP